MNACTVNNEIMNEETALKALAAASDRLDFTVSQAERVMDDLRELIVNIRPTGLLTVDEIAAAIDHNRNYVDSVWSIHGETRKGKQTRVSRDDVDPAEVALAKQQLTSVSTSQRSTARSVVTARAERDRLVVLVYASKLLGPTDISRAVGIDRNHVLRLARKAGIMPVHRPGARNQYSKNSK